MSITFFHAPGSRTIKAFNEAISSDLHQHIEMVQAFADTKPRHGHLVLAAGDGTPSKDLERFAARLGAYLVCVPEASDWLTRHVRNRVAAGLPLVMVDAALAGTKQLSGAK